jgi:moderate conductance mechanosensitive channel
VNFLSSPSSHDWLTTGIAIVVALIVWRLVDAAITRFYARHFVSRFIPRVSTYSGITKSIASAIIFIGLLLEILNVWHVNVAPALGAAGVVGIVIGFGAQSLVKDVLTGIFFLFEDAFDVGDGVELVTSNGTVAGVVDAISLREIRVIDDRGYLFSVPCGSIVYVSNATRYPMRLNIDFTVPLQDHVGDLRKHITSIAEEAVRQSGMEVEGLSVRLSDVSSGGATFRIHFQAKRKQASVAASHLRELIASELQAHGYLPKADQAATPQQPANA